MGNSHDQAGVAHGTVKGEGLLTKPKAIAFDFDGTLVDSVDYMANTWLELARSMKIKPEVNVRDLMGMTGTQIARVLAKGDKALIARMMTKRREYFDVDRYLKSVKLFPESAAVLAELKRRGYGMAVASSATTERVRQLAEAFQVSRFFDVIVGGDEVTRSKPSPDLVLEAARRLRVRVSRMAYVGDTNHDVEAARKAGSVTVLVLRGGLDYQGPQPDLLVNSLSGLLDSFL